MTLTRSPKPLRDVLYAFSLDERELGADLLDEYIRDYPEHAEDLTDFAIQMALDALRIDSAVEEAESAIDPAKQSPMVSRAISRFQNRLHETKRGTPAVVRRTVIDAGSVTNPIASLDRAGLRALAQDLHSNTTFVLKLRDRQIEPETMTAGFVAHVAKVLKIQVDALIAHFKAPMHMQTSRQLYKADQKPQVVCRQSFAQAVQSSGLSEEQRQHLLSL